jgi:hypothetical protein
MLRIYIRYIVSGRRLFGKAGYINKKKSENRYWSEVKDWFQEDNRKKKVSGRLRQEDCRPPR